MDFNQLGLLSPLLRALREEGYSTPTPIQEQAIPPVLHGRDLLGCAQTGTGKTAAFALPILQRLQENPVKNGGIRALVLTPTRELALQIYESFCAYGRHVRQRCCVIYGGVSQKPQTDALRRGVDILVATPGRLNDLIGQGYIDLGKIEVFVLDEADRMLDMGFIHDVKRVIAKLPQRRQTLLFSATMPGEIAKLVDTILHDPVTVKVAPVSSTVDTIAQSVYFVDKQNKRKLLIYLLADASIVSALVFTRTKHGADRVAKELARAGIEAKAIHGDKSQGARQSALQSFKGGKIRVLVATDIAARGIDIEELSHVINFDLPNIPETYVHRIGRTGRAGLSGTAISFCDCDEKPYLADIEKLIHKKVPVVEGHPFPMLITDPSQKPAPQPRPPRGGGRGRQGQAAPKQKESVPKKVKAAPEKPQAQKVSLPNTQKQARREAPPREAAQPDRPDAPKKPPRGGSRRGGAGASRPQSQQSDELVQRISTRASKGHAYFRKG